ncbi:hypothetical protein K7G98_33645, partial [Saccharothrix sp. MB29]|nr:hypothetical protein [Saccharothrix sp. MB29]
HVERVLQRGLGGRVRVGLVRPADPVLGAVLAARVGRGGDGDRHVADVDLLELVHRRGAGGLVRGVGEVVQRRGGLGVLVTAVVAVDAALATGASEWSFVFIPNYEAVYTSKDPEHYKLWFPPVLGIHGLWFNTKVTPWDNPALRRAVNMVINRDDIFTQGEAGYFYPKVDHITGIPLPAGASYIAPEFKDKTVKV